MINRHWFSGGVALTIALISTSCIAVSWQDKLSNTSGNIAAGTQSGGLSLASLTTMLAGGNSALSANTMANAAGVIEYCAKHKISSMVNAENIQNQLVQKLGLSHSRNDTAKSDYNQGKSGLLNTLNGQQLDMSNLSQSELAEKVKTKACDLVLKQGMDYLDH